MNLIPLLVLISLSNNVLADVFSEDAEMVCDEYSINVSMMCGCLSDLSREDMKKYAAHNCSVDIKGKKGDKDLKLRPVKIADCYAGYEIVDFKTYLCVEKQYDSKNVTFFKDSLKNSPRRKKCN